MRWRVFFNTPGCTFAEWLRGDWLQRKVILRPNSWKSWYHEQTHGNNEKLMEILWKFCSQLALKLVKMKRWVCTVIYNQARTLGINWTVASTFTKFSEQNHIQVTMRKYSQWFWRNHSEPYLKNTACQNLPSSRSEITFGNCEEIVCQSWATVKMSKGFRRSRESQNCGK